MQSRYLPAKVRAQSCHLPAKVTVQSTHIPAKVRTSVVFDCFSFSINNNAYLSVCLVVESVGLLLLML